MHAKPAENTAKVADNTAKSSEQAEAAPAAAADSTSHPQGQAAALFGAWAQPAFNRFAQFPSEWQAHLQDQWQQAQARVQASVGQIPVAPALHAQVKSSADAVARFLDNCAKGEAATVGQMKAWVDHVHQMQLAGIDYLAQLNGEARRIAAAQLHAWAAAVAADKGNDASATKAS